MNRVFKNSPNGKVTREKIEEKSEELMELFRQYLNCNRDEDDGRIKGMAEKIIVDVVHWCSDNHYEALGIFEEAMQTYRQISLDHIKNDHCEECDGEIEDEDGEEAK